MQSCINVLAYPAKRVKVAQRKDSNVPSSPCGNASFTVSKSCTVMCTPSVMSSMSTVISSAGSGDQSKANLPPITMTTTSIMSSAGTTTTTSVTSSTGSGCYSKANLPPELLDNGKWQKILMPALLLWAGESDDVWTVFQAAIDYALLLIIDLKSDLDLTGMCYDSPTLCVSFFISPLDHQHCWAAHDDYLVLPVLPFSFL